MYSLALESTAAVLGLVQFDVLKNAGACAWSLRIEAPRVKQLRNDGQLENWGIEGIYRPYISFKLQSLRVELMSGHPNGKWSVE